MVEENVRVKSFCPECGEEFEGDLEECPNDGSRLQEVTLPDDDYDDDPLLGQQLDDRFALQSVLGEGGMGRVYRGMQLSVEREVAVKVLRSELSREETIIKRFFREAKVISSLSHPNIVNLVDFGQDSEAGVLYLAMEFIDGYSLGELLDQGRLRAPLAVDIAMQACAALSDPHDREIVHRDLKPENLMLVPLTDGRVQLKVVDFGIAHTLKQTQKLTKTGTVFGTPHYMAPEQAQGKDVGPHTDIYSLGVILYEMVSGAPPFEGDTSMRVMFQHIREEPPPIDSIVGSERVPDELTRLIRSMMSKRAVERPASAVEVRGRLREIQRAHRFEEVNVDPTADGEVFEDWIVERDEQRPVEDTSNPPGTGGEPSAPGTDEFGRSPEQSEAVESQRAPGPAAGERDRTPHRGERPNPPATRSGGASSSPQGAAAWSSWVWVGIGAGVVLALVALTVGTWFFLERLEERRGDGAGGSAAVAAGADGGDEGASERAAVATSGGDAAGASERAGANPKTDAGAGETGRRASADTGSGAESEERTGSAGGSGGSRPPGETTETAAEPAAGETEDERPEARESSPEPERDEPEDPEAASEAGDEEKHADSEPAESGGEASDQSEESSDSSEIATPDFGGSGSESDGAAESDSGASDEESGAESGEESSGDEEGGGFYPME